MTSPNDPVFFLHHCFVDKAWADWQEVQKKNNPDGTPHYAPLRDGPPGHNFGDQLKPWTRAVRDVLDIGVLGLRLRTVSKPANDHGGGQPSRAKPGAFTVLGRLKIARGARALRHGHRRRKRLARAGSPRRSVR